MSLLEIKNLKKSFGDNVVLKDISLSVDREMYFQ
jgi:polar amino acid transport system ATP-binding protein